MNGTLFYIFGITLVVSALVVALVGLRIETFPQSRGALAGVVIYFVALVGATTTFAVLHAADDQHARQAAEAQAATQAGGATTTGAGAGGPAGKVNVSASPSAIAFQQKSLQAKAGKVSFDFTNPSAVQHNFCLESSSGQQLGCSGTIAQSSDSLDVSLAAGQYTFYCNVDSHRQAGMQGTVTAK